MHTYQGGCHCGAVRFEAALDLGEVIACNCSHCSKKGFLLSFTGASQFTLLSGEDRLAEYRFNTHKIGHRFCTVCGTQAFAQGEAPNGGQMAAVNVRCLDGVDVATLRPTPFDNAG